MDAFGYREGELHAEGVALSRIASRFGTPVYVYSRAAVESQFDAFDQAFSRAPSHLVCYAVKANSNLAILDLLARRGAGFDIVSSGELRRVLRAGGDPRRVVFSGVAKSRADIEQALEAGILCFNIESAAELARLQQLAVAHGVEAPVSLRVNPDVDAGSHPYISTGLRENKFGIPLAEAGALYRQAMDMRGIRITGIDCHIGSQLVSVAPVIDAIRRILGLVDQLGAEGIALEHIDVGGGLGVAYRDENPPSIAEYARAVLDCLAGRQIKVIAEPGRVLVARAGVLLTRVEYLKDNGSRHFAVVDAGMNDLIRPSLYGAWMNIEPVLAEPRAEYRSTDVVGPVCESSDFLGKERLLGVQAGDLLAVHGAGAYGFGMSSNYNSRCRCAEVMVDGKSCHLVRAREEFEDLVRGECLLPGVR